MTDMWRFLRNATRGATWLVAVLALGWTAAAFAGTNVWTTGGPVGGNTVISMAVDPQNGNTLYAGLLYTPLYKSADGGAHWTALSLYVPNSNTVGAIAVDPTNSNIVYAAWSGIAKSIDGGAHWSGYGGPSYYVSCIVIDPANTSILYAGGNSGHGVSKSLDAGGTWTDVINGLTNKNVVAMVMVPGSPEALYAATEGGGVFKTTDGGANWTAVNTGLGNHTVRGLTVDPGTGTLYASTGGGVFKTANGGANWAAAGLSGQSVYPIAADASGNLYAMVHPGGLYFSADGGTNWNPVGAGISGGVNAIITDPSIAGTVHVGVDDNGTYKTTNSGGTWTQQADGFGSHLEVISLAVDPADSTVQYCGSGNGIYKTTNSGTSWTKITAGLTYSIVADASVSPTRLYAAVSGTGVRESLDGGTTWTTINNGAPFANINFVGQDSTDPSVLYAGTNGNGLFKSTDGGASWTNLQTAGSGLPTVYTSFGCVAFDPNNAGTVYVGNQFSAGIYKTSDGGTSWSTVYSSSDYGVYDIAVAPYDSNTVYAASYGNANGIVKTTDGGTNWTAINSGLLCKGVATVALDPAVAGKVYIGIRGCSFYPTGVFVSSDGGASWTGINPGLTNKMVHALMLDPNDPSTLVAGTEGGVFSLTQTPPSVTGISPVSGTTAGGTSVVITGAVFTGATAVAFGATPAASFTVDSDTQITAISPAHAAGAVDVTVSGPFGTSATSTVDQFTFVCPSISVGPSRIPAGATGIAYNSVTFTQVGGTNPIAWGETGTLPAGMAFSAAGVLSGTPTETGSFPITVTATDAQGCTGSANYTLVVDAPPTPASAPGLTTAPATACAQETVIALDITPTLTVTDGSEVLGDVLISNVPAGATLSAGTDQGGGTWLLNAAQLSGLTITVPAGTSSFTLGVQASEAKQTVLYPVADSYVDSSYPSTNFGTSNELDVLHDRWYSYLRFDLADVPPGADVSDATFSIVFFNGYAYGGGGNHYLYFVTDDTWSETGITWANRPAYDPTYLGYWWPWNNNTPRYWVFNTAVTPTVRTEFAGDQWVSFCIGNNGDPPGYSGRYYSREKGATDGPKLYVDHDPSYTSASLAVTVLAPVVVSPSSVPDATASLPYSQNFAASGAGGGPYTYGQTGSLPNGLAFTGNTLSGTPTQTGQFTFTITAQDTVSGCTGGTAYTLTVVCPTIDLLPASLPPAVKDQPYYQTLTPSAGVGPFSFALTGGQLPDGLTLSSDGVLSGTPTVSGSFSITVTVTDVNECTGSRSYTLATYTSSFHDDGNMSALCVDTTTGAFQWSVAGGQTYTGTLNVYNGGTMFWSQPGASQYVYLYYDPNNHMAWGYLYDYGTYVYSSLYDSNTLNNPPGCGVALKD